MRKLTFPLFILFVVSTALINPLKTMAAEVVNNASYYISWHNLPPQDHGDKYQLYFGQANTNKEENTIFNGLNRESKGVTLNNLKPCTEYSWSLRSGKGDKWSWVILHNKFTTTGSCENTPTVTTFERKQVQVAGNSSAVARWTTVAGARFYNVYYKVCGENKNLGAVRVPDKGLSVEIGYLDPNKSYCYQVAAMVGNKEVFMPEQKLTTGKTSVKPVLGVVSKPNLAQRTPPKTQSVPTGLAENRPQNCTNTGSVTLTLAPEKGITVNRTHILYAETGQPFKYALRNLPANAKTVTIGSLNTCATYNFQPIDIGTDNRSHSETVITLKPSN